MFKEETKAIKINEKLIHCIKFADDIVFVVEEIMNKSNKCYL